MSEKYEGNVAPSSVEKATLEYDLYAQRVVDIPSNMRKRLNYGARTDGNPVYVGFAKRDLAEDADGWLLYYLQYDESDRCISVDVAIDSWDNRATADYSL